MTICVRAFELVKQVFEDNFKFYGDIGASFCLRINGEIVVDLWDGYQNDKATPPIPWNKDTVCNVYSCTKAMANICILKLIDKDLLSFESKISSFWFDFGQNGKENITVEQLLTHQAGLTTLGEIRLSENDLLEWTDYLHGNGPVPPLYNVIVSQKPFWEIGKGHFGYHPLTIGLYLSEVVRRVDPNGRR